MENSANIQAAIFDIDGTLVDSVDLHALAWHEAFAHFGYDVSFEAARSQIGKGGDKLLPVFLNEEQNRADGEALEQWRGEHFKKHYLQLVRPFSAVPALLQRLRDRGIKLAAASSAKEAELDVYLEIAQVSNLFDAKTSSSDAQESKPAPDIFEAALKKLGISPQNAIAIGDSPYDAQAAARLGMRSIGLLSGSFTEESLRDAGCVAVYPGIGALFACLDDSVLIAG